MIYSYIKKDKLVKIDDKAVYLTEKEDKIFRAIYKNKKINSIAINDVNELLYDGYGTITAVKTFIKKLSNKLGVEIDLRK